MVVSYTAEASLKEVSEVWCGDEGLDVRETDAMFAAMFANRRRTASENDEGAIASRLTKVADDAR